MADGEVVGVAIGGVDDEEAGRDSGPSGGDVSGRVRVLSGPGICGSVILVWGIIYTLLLPTAVLTSSSVFA